MAVAQFVVSIASVLAVLVAVYYGYKLNEILSSRTEEASYYKKLYDCYLTEMIPSTMKKTKEEIIKQYTGKNDKQRINLESIEDVVTMLLDDSFFAKYEDVDFYNAIEKSVIEIEEYCENTMEQELTQSAAMKSFVKLDMLIASLYKVILKKNIIKK